ANSGVRRPRASHAPGNGLKRSGGRNMRKASGVRGVIKTVLLGAALSLTTATASSAQSYDPDVGSGNLVRPFGGARYFGGIRPAWRAMVPPPRVRPPRHRRARH